MMRIFPFLLFIALCVGLLLSLYNLHNAHEEHSGVVSMPWSGVPVKDAKSAALTLDAARFNHRLTLVNMFASWCLPCQEEMPDLVKFKAQTHAQFIGIVWNDSPETMRDWLKKYGNPFDTVYYDTTGQAAIALGLRGVPESFIIDAHGTIRYHRVGIISPELVQHELLPLMQQWAKE